MMFDKNFHDDMVELEKEWLSARQNVVAALEAIDFHPEIALSPIHPLAQAANASMTSLGELLQRFGKQHPLAPEPEILPVIERLMEQPVFIGGVHKSGTTLLRNLLDGHPDLLVLPTDGRGFRWIKEQGRQNMAVAPEKLFIEMIRSLINPIYGVPPTWVLGNALPPYLHYARAFWYWQHALSKTIKGGLLAQVGGFYAAMQKGGSLPEKRFWVEKSTDNPQEAEALLALFPNARFIQIVRHPVAVIASQKRKEPMKNRRFSLFKEVDLLQQGMQQGLSNFQQFGRNVYHLLNYEDLVCHPQNVMRTIADFLGIRFDDILTIPTVNGLPAGANTAYQEQSFPQGQIISVTLTHGEKYLQPAELTLIHALLSHFLRVYQYDSPTVSFWRYLLALFTMKRVYNNHLEYTPIHFSEGLRRWFRSNGVAATDL